MLEKTNLLLAVPPAQVRGAARFHLPLAHVAYRVGGGPHLFRASIPVSIRGGYMVIDNAGFSGGGEPGPFCQEVLRECAARGFTGAVCDFSGRPVPPLSAIVQNLGEAFQRRGWPLYVTEGYGGCSDKCRVLISSALSGGSLRQRLQEAVQRFGRVVLAVERVAEDCYLPSPPGRARPSPVMSWPSAWRNARLRSTFPPICAPTISPTCPTPAGPTSSSLTTPGPSAKSSSWPVSWTLARPCCPMLR